MIFTDEKAKMANNILNKKVSTAGVPAITPPQYNFYKQKSKKLAVISQFTSILTANIPVAFYVTFISKLATTLTLQFL